MCDDSIRRDGRNRRRDRFSVVPVDVIEEVVARQRVAVDSQYRRHGRPGEQHFAVDGDGRDEPVRPAVEDGRSRRVARRCFSASVSAGAAGGRRRRVGRIEAHARSLRVMSDEI